MRIESMIHEWQPDSLGNAEKIFGETQRTKEIGPNTERQEGMVL